MNTNINNTDKQVCFDWWNALTISEQTKIAKLYLNKEPNINDSDYYYHCYLIDGNNPNYNPNIFNVDIKINSKF